AKVNELLKQPKSHPLRVRGLKLADSLQYTTIRFVAPFAGAWIEINNDYFFINSLSSPLCGCVVSTILNLSNYAIKIV
ncbi:TPA: hypothetical protein ACGM4I_001085, partial [Streptococcus agalactiae]